MAVTHREAAAATPPQSNGRGADRAAVARRGERETARVLAAELAVRIGGEVRFDRTSRMAETASTPRLTTCPLAPTCS